MLDTPAVGKSSLIGGIAPSSVKRHTRSRLGHFPYRCSGFGSTLCYTKAMLIDMAMLLLLMNKQVSWILGCCLTFLMSQRPWLSSQAESHT